MTESIEIKTLARAQGTVSAPPSKSYTNRAYVIAALSDGTARLERPLFSDDTRYMREALSAFGIPVEEGDACAIVQGQGGRLVTPDKELFIGNAGTTTFLPPGSVISSNPFDARRWGSSYKSVGF